MSFLGGLAAGIGKIFAEAIVSEISDKVEAMVRQSLNRSEAYEKADKEKVELAREMAGAKTQEERDAILDKIYEARPKFS